MGAPAYVRVLFSKIVKERKKTFKHLKTYLSGIHKALVYINHTASMQSTCKGEHYFTFLVTLSARSAFHRTGDTSSLSKKEVLLVNA